MQISQDEIDLAERVATEISGRPASAIAAEDQRAIVALTLEDYVQHVAGFAVGLEGVCGFVQACLVSLGEPEI